MIIKNISFGNNVLQLSNQVNIITGHTSANKTLLFFAFEYLFCIDSSIKIEEAIKNLNSEYISAEFVDNDEKFTVKRYFSKSFNAYVDDEHFTSATTYKKIIAKKFGFSQIYIQNGDKKNQFFLKDYIKIIMIPEEQLTSTKNIFERGGELDKIKMHLFFNYMISGKSINVDLINKSSEIKRSEKTINSIKTTFNRVFSKPKKKELEDYSNHERILDEYMKKMNEHKLEIAKISQEITSLKLENKRFDILLNSYNQDLKDYDLAFTFDNYDKLDDNLSTIDFEYYKAINDTMIELSRLKNVNEEKIVMYNDKLNVIETSYDEIDRKFVEEKNKKFDKILLYKEMENVSKSMENENVEKFKLIEKDLDVEVKEIKNVFDKNINILCNNIKDRIANWNVRDVNEVSFDNANYDFLFNNKPIKIQPKGLKSICTLATNLEIILFMKNNGISVPSFLIIDSLWIGSDFKYISKNEFKQSIINDIKDCGIQIAIFENEDNNDILTNCKYIQLNN